MAKKASFKKNKKKFYEKRTELRKIKEQKDELRKLGLITKVFAEKVHADEVLMITRLISKLIEHDQNAYQELIDLFQMIDQKCSIGIDSRF